jgi:membrane protein implicated in regulation of membrane protease activity
MKVLFTIVVVVALVGSVVADYLWRRWMDERRRDRQ